ncbi:MAG: cadherin-like domain-containing protein, partial [Bacteroidetes bacterium]|nr:cadherin-like domain-containing protein [Bacteroidota bacterium]
MKKLLIAISCLLYLTSAATGQSDIQSVNHLPVLEGGTPQCVNTLYDVQFKACSVYSEGMKTAELVTRLWNLKQCTRYESVRYEPPNLQLSFGAKENFKTVSITVKSASGKTFEGKVLIHKKSKTPCNVAPVAVNDQFIAGADKPTTGKVGSNDKDEDNDYLVFSLTAKPQHAAQFTLNEDGSFTYTPVKGYKGQDEFKYRTSDGLESAEATVYLNVLEYGIQISLAASIELGCPR